MTIGECTLPSHLFAVASSVAARVLRPTRTKPPSHPQDAQVLLAAALSVRRGCTRTFLPDTVERSGSSCLAGDLLDLSSTKQGKQAPARTNQKTSHPGHANGRETSGATPGELSPLHAGPSSPAASVLSRRFLSYHRQHMHCSASGSTPSTARARAEGAAAAAAAAARECVRVAEVWALSKGELVRVRA